MKPSTYDQLFPFQHRWLEIDGANVHYTDEGNGNVLLFCHPSIATSFMYRTFIKELSGSYRCITLDFPGFGFSVAGPGYTHSIQSQSVIVEKLISQLSLDNIFPVMQEIGGHAAIIALSKTPEKVKGIIITDTIIFPTSEYPKISKMLEIVNGRVFNFLNTNFNFLVRVAYRFGVRKRKLHRDEKAVYRDFFDTREKRKLMTQMLYNLKSEESLMQEVKKKFETIFKHKPALLIYGDKDPMYQMGIPDRIHKMLPCSNLFLIKDEAHFPHEGAPEEMIAIMKNWLSRPALQKVTQTNIS